MPHHQPDDAPTLAVRDSFLCRVMVLLALKTTARFYRRTGACYPISKNLIVKTSEFVHLTEAVTMEYVASNTSAPVPRVYCTFIHRHRAYIVIERVQGDTLALALQTLSDADRADIFAQLRRIFSELRTLLAPSERIESCAGGSLRDSHIPNAGNRYGPFDTICGMVPFLLGIYLRMVREQDSGSLASHDCRIP